MGGGEDVVPRRVDDGALLLRVPAPEEEDDSLATVGQLADRAVGELLPALARVRGGLAGGDGEHRVQQEHARARPRA